MGRLTQSVKNVALFLFGVVLVAVGYRTNEAHAQAKAEAAKMEAAKVEAEKLDAEKAKNAADKEKSKAKEKAKVKAKKKSKLEKAKPEKAHASK
mgnify:CR=1 FL=1